MGRKILFAIYALVLVIPAYANQTSFKDPEPDIDYSETKPGTMLASTGLVDSVWTKSFIQSVKKNSKFSTFRRQEYGHTKSIICEFRITRSGRLIDPAVVRSNFTSAQDQKFLDALKGLKAIPITNKALMKAPLDLEVSSQKIQVLYSRAIAAGL